ncbi:MAG: hypothetical protein FJ135_16215 [Deltaproteobacteria bacterium]|nr:hypothetical protein [Deltaproteobacteria bacterium]
MTHIRATTVREWIKIPTDRRYLEQWRVKLNRPPLVQFLINKRPETELFAPFLELFQTIVPEAPILTEPIPDTELPGLALGENWRVHAVPEGKRLEILGDILLALDNQAPPLTPEVLNRWQNLPLAPELTVFIAPQCPYCPQMVRQLIPLSVTPPRASVIMIDAGLFTELAREHEIKAVPTVIVNGVYRLTGAFSLTDLLELAEKTDPAQLPASVLERMLKEGQAGQLAAFMVAQGVIFPNFLPLLIHPEINIRLGAMVVLESIGEENPDLTATVLSWLWEALPASEIPVQGDIIYLIGEWGDAGWQETLRTALAAAIDPDLREALEEALDKIQASSA